MEIDFEKFKGSLPYASELYGVYQPLLGWRSGLMTRRIVEGLAATRVQYLKRIVQRFTPRFDIRGEPQDPREVNFQIGLAQEKPRVSSPLLEATGSLIAREVLASVEQSGIDNPNAWHRATREEVLTDMLDRLHDRLRAEFASRLQRVERLDPRTSLSAQQRMSVLQSILGRESVAAGVLHSLHQRGDLEGLMMLAAPTDSSPRALRFVSFYKDLALFIDPRKSELANAVISPIGIAHIFRQFFFEFDTFLGPSVEHLWLSPGGTVELVEVSVRRTLTERVTESALEAGLHTETSITQQDELSDAVRQENASNTKFGVSLNTNNSFSLGEVFTTAVDTGTSFDLDDSQKTSRENLHKSLRQQTEKVSTDLKRSFKTVFRTVSETTDTKSRRHVIQNTTPNLINYEMRRKMRQVGVQVQDLGTHLCWQTYVDLPGDQLGLANMVHIAAAGDMEPTQPPELPPSPEPYKGDAIKHGFDWPYSDDEDDPSLYREYIVRVIEVFPKPGYVLKGAQLTRLAGPEAGFRVRLEDERSVAPSDAAVTEKTPVKLVVHLPNDIDGEHGKRVPRWDDNPRFDLEIVPSFEPSEWLRNKITAEYSSKLKEAKEAEQREYKEKLFKAVEERVKLSSEIVSRKFEDLREEERIVVYRKLIGQLMAGTGVDKAEPRVRHVFAELVQSMFDVEKMLYFVAPEWWMPHNRHARQNVFVPVTKEDGNQDTDERQFLESSTVSWGGGRADRPDNYLITKDSARARLGSSLGWVIQLDGDNLRNAFLNAPWVKAVVPIREGKEQRAFDWLSSSHVEGADGLDAGYEPADPAELTRIRTKLGLAPNYFVTIRDAIRYLVARVQEKQAAARKKSVDEDGSELDYLPTEQVYEHGFYPLQGGFKAAGKDFEIFDQWVEVVPTDQIVPVAVEYDPKTGKLK